MRNFLLPQQLFQLACLFRSNGCSHSWATQKKNKKYFVYRRCRFGASYSTGSTWILKQGRRWTSMFINPRCSHFNVRVTRAQKVYILPSWCVNNTETGKCVERTNPSKVFSRYQPKAAWVVDFLLFLMQSCRCDTPLITFERSCVKTAAPVNYSSGGEWLSDKKGPGQSFITPTTAHASGSFLFF